MSSTNTEKSNGLFHFNWAAFDAGNALKYAIGVIIVWGLSEGLGFPWFIGGVAALLTWLTDVPGPRRDRVLGMVALALLCIPLSLISELLGTNLWPNVIAMFIVAFVFTTLMGYGSRPYMVGWSTILWFIYVPLFNQSEELPQVIASLLVGAGVVIGLTLLGALIQRWRGGDQVATAQTSDAQALPGRRFVLGYSLAVAVTMALAVLIGWLTLISDPSLVANGAFFIIGPASRQTWIKGIERIIATVLGVIVGFWIFQGIESTAALVLLVAVASYFCLGMMNVNYGAFVFFFVIYMSLGWGLLPAAEAYFRAGERIQAELIAVVLGGVAIAVLQWWAKRADEQNHVRAQLSTA